ncbi:MAG TPA: rod shape-determining protein MreC [Bryobacteraceae bacterium]|nr:rod shape-determining protein MreC [Bryobacteraceae bacterium]
MELLLNRYRNLTVLVIAIVAQLALLAYQVKGNGEVRLIRVWAVSAVTPLARLIEGSRSNISRFFTDYFVLLDVRDENKRMRAELERTKLDNQYLQTELATADRARSLAIFQQQSPSKTVAAHVIGNSTAVTSKVVIVDRGTNSGIEKGMAVITPDGIVGKVTGAYPTASYVLLITDPTFAAGVISQKNRVHGTLKGQGYSTAMVDYVQNEERLETGEWFYTSGDDRIFPKGLPVGEATVVRPGKSHKEIYVTPSGLQNGLEEVLIIVQGVHAPIPDSRPSSQDVHLMAPPPGEGSSDPAPAVSGTFTTDADRLTDHYRKIGEAEKHVYGGHSPGAPNYNIDLDAVSSKAAVSPKAPVSPKDTVSPKEAINPKAPVSPKPVVSPKPADPKPPSPPPAIEPLAAPPAANP